MIVMTSVFVICGAIRKECQVPPRLLAVGLDSEGAGLDAVVPLDALLLPLIVCNVPGELELGVAHTAGAAPGGCGRGSRGTGGPAPATGAHTDTAFLPLSGPRHTVSCE